MPEEGEGGMSGGTEGGYSTQGTEPTSSSSSELPPPLNPADFASGSVPLPINDADAARLKEVVMDIAVPLGAAIEEGFHLVTSGGSAPIFVVPTDVLERFLTTEPTEAGVDERDDSEKG